jgi:two-component system, NtrC family, sensor histidine kinase HydH
MGDERRSARIRRISLMFDQVNSAAHLLPRLGRDAVCVALFASAGFRGARLAAVAAMLAAAALVPIVLGRGARGRGDPENRAFAIALLAQLCAVGAMALSGGLYSPLLPSVAAVMVLPSSLHADDRRSDTLSLALLGAVAALLLVPRDVTGPPLPRAEHAGILLVSMAGALLVAHTVMRRVNGVASAVDQAMHEERVAQVVDAEASKRRLHEVGARVAHELKNPLTAVKSLVQLVRRSLDGSRAARIDDMLARIDAMQDTVKAYLSFARPVDDSAPRPPVPSVREARLDRHRMLSATAGKLMGWALKLSAVMVVVQVVLLWRGGMPGWRVAVVLVITAVVTFQQKLNAYLISGRGKPRDSVDLQYKVNCLTGQSWAAAVSAMTGGVYSSFLATASAHMVILEPRDVRRSWMVGSVQVMWLGVVALLPLAWVGPVVPTWHYEVATIACLAWAVVLIRATSTAAVRAGDAAQVKVDEVRAERLRDAGAMIDRLRAVASRVADELNGPIDEARAAVAAVLAETPEPKLRDRLTVVAGELARLQTIVADYLAATRPLEDLEARPLELSAVVADSLAVVAGRTEHGRIGVELLVQEVHVHADPRRLREALLNVLSNALDATPEGGRLRVETAAVDGGGATIVVTDSGCGMAPEQLARLGEAWVTTRADGTGLGVSLIHGVVARHGGTVGYVSEPGSGTRVTITLPARPPDGGAADQRAVSPPSIGSSAPVTNRDSSLER